MGEIVAIVLGAIATLGAAIAGVISKRAVDKVTAAKLAAETESVYIRNAENLVRLMETRIDGMQKELDTLRAALKKYQEDLTRALNAEITIQKELQFLRARIDQLEAYIKQHGLSVPTV